MISPLRAVLECLGLYDAAVMHEIQPGEQPNLVAPDRITPQSGSCRLDRTEQPVCLIVDAGGEEELIAVPCEPTIPEGESP